VSVGEKEEEEEVNMTWDKDLLALRKTRMSIERNT
jgi:hypothetical protein